VLSGNCTVCAGQGDQSWPAWDCGRRGLTGGPA
jgi:hypothetical protein